MEILCKCPDHGGEGYIKTRTLDDNWTVVWKCDQCNFCYIKKSDRYKIGKICPTNYEDQIQVEKVADTLDQIDSLLLTLKKDHGINFTLIDEIQ